MGRRRLLGQSGTSNGNEWILCVEIWRTGLQASGNGFGDRSLQSGKPSDVFPRRIWKGAGAPSNSFEKNVPTAGIHAGCSKIREIGEIHQ